MNKNIIHSSIFINIFKKIGSFFLNITENSFIFFKIPNTLKRKLKKIKVRHVGIFLAIFIIIKRNMFFDCDSNTILALVPLFYALFFICAVFMLCSLDLEELYKNSLFKKAIGVNT